MLALADRSKDLPRHLGIHSGGMVICDRPIADVCPVEWARMENRSVLQWDKDDCAAVGLVKFDLLGLGMLSALHYMIDLVAEHKGIEVDLAQLDLSEPAVYEMLQRADSVGVFQVESRAQMATLPRLKPRNFYDLVVEVALIRPGPIQGGSVHPYIRRRNGIEPVTYDHPSLETSLRKTLGVPLFQEQLMQMAIDVRRVLRRRGRPAAPRHGVQAVAGTDGTAQGRFYDGMRELHGITDEMADRIYEKLYAFANFGFPESHSQSFAALVFYSSWFKLHHPAAFCAGLLRAQPMGFYSPQSLVADARRHGVVVHGPDINASLARRHAGERRDRGAARPRRGPAHRRRPRRADRRGANGRGPYASFLDLTGRVELSVAQAESLATAGALGCFGITRREALWAAGAAAGERPDRLPGLGVTVAPRAAGHERGRTRRRRRVGHRDLAGQLSHRVPAPATRRARRGPRRGLLALPDGNRVLVGGAVTHRQRPATAAGVTFINLEDETGMVNVVCSVGPVGALPQTRADRAGAADPRQGAERRGRGHRGRRPVGPLA